MSTVWVCVLSIASHYKESPSTKQKNTYLKNWPGRGCYNSARLFTPGERKALARSLKFINNHGRVDYGSWVHGHLTDLKICLPGVKEAKI